jgi:transcriptional/translational regulatory protein YebC/TACO1
MFDEGLHRGRQACGQRGDAAEHGAQAGADDMRDDGEHWEVLSDPSSFEAVKDAVKGLGIEPASAQVAMRRRTT